jgi:hypothetical protein
VALVTWAAWVVAAVAVAAVGLMLAASQGVYYGAALPMGVAGATCLVAARVQERRERGQLRLRHCLECGASVADSAAVCARCQSVRLEAPVDAERGGGPTGSRPRREGREMPVTAYSSDASGVIGWVDAAPPASWSAAGEMTARVLTRWGTVLLGVAAVLVAAGITTRP